MAQPLSRRNFLKGSIIIAAGAIGSYALAGCTGAGNASTNGASGGTGAAGGSSKVTLHRGYVVAHGDKCFTQVVVAVDEEGIIRGVDVDDYQFMSASTQGLVPVPNSDSDFSAGIVEGYQLASKKDNNDVYSAMMAEKAGSTVKWADSMAAIEEYAVGKKPDELKSAGLDTVSGATLVDAPNYLAGIAEVAENDAIASEGTFDPSSGEVALGRVNASCHGTKAFGNAVSLVQGNAIIAASIDEFQFVAVGDNVVSVPNSDAAFGTDYYVAGQTLTSKSANNEAYSAMLAEKAGSTTPWLTSIEAIEGALAGQKTSDVSIDGPDAVSGATLVDTANYAKAAIAAAKAV